ncbi:MAG: PorP/SprF family type IX secretion system membrane protein, partial [Bacteroidota bacterium]
MKKLILLIASFCLLTTINAQEEAIFGHYTANKILINPAAAGFDRDNHQFFLNVRNQWTGFVGAPETYAFSYNGPIGKNLGVGALLFTENIASFTRYRMQLNYAFNYNIKDVKLGFGMSTEFHRMQLNSAILDNPLYDQGDDLIEENVDGIRSFDASFGIYAELPEGTFFGLTLPNLIKNRLDEIAGTDDTALLRYYLFNAGHRFKIEEKKMTVEPSILFKKVRGVPTLIDLNVRAGFLDDKLMTGLTYRMGDGGSLAFLVGTKYKNLQFFYSYDAFMGDFQVYSAGSHEFTVALQLSKGSGGKYDRS